MLFKLLRNGGALLTRAAVEAEPWTIAKLETRSGMHLMLRTISSAPDKPPIAELFMATVRHVDEREMILRGVERAGEAAVIQEWRLKIPPDLGGAGLASEQAEGIRGW